MTEGENKKIAEAWNELKEALKKERPYCYIYRLMILIVEKLEGLLN